MYAAPDQLSDGMVALLGRRPPVAMLKFPVDEGFSKVNPLPLSAFSAAQLAVQLEVSAR